jgi:hypothetical protein
MIFQASNQRATRQKAWNVSAFPEEHGTGFQAVPQALASGTVAPLEIRPQYQAVFACCFDKLHEEFPKQGR